MYYTVFQGEKLSALGMGIMRLPVVDGDDAKIDAKAVEGMFGYAMGAGMTPFPCAGNHRR